MRIAFVFPHMFMHRKIFGKTIFSPGDLSLNLVKNLSILGHNITFYSPSFSQVDFTNYYKEKISNEILKNISFISFDDSMLVSELEQRNYGFMELFSKHPLTFITLSRQIQMEIISGVMEDANLGKFDIVHFFINEEETGLVFAKHFKVPCVFTHHDPFNYLWKYRSIFYKYKNLNWISISKAQRKTAPKGTNFISNIYHGIDEILKEPIPKIQPDENNGYFLYLGRIIEAKGVHLAIEACKMINKRLIIVGKHFSGNNKELYWDEKIYPHIDNKSIIYEGYINEKDKINELLLNSKGLIIPSVFQEPFGLVMIEALSCGVPLIGLDNGAIPEIIENGKNGFLVKTVWKEVLRDGKIINEVSETETSARIADALKKIDEINREDCYKIFKGKYTSSLMAKKYVKTYLKAINSYRNK